MGTPIPWLFIVYCFGLVTAYLIGTNALTKLIRLFPYSWRGRRMSVEYVASLDRVLGRTGRSLVKKKVESIEGIVGISINVTVKYKDGRVRKWQDCLEAKPIQDGYLLLLSAEPGWSRDFRVKRETLLIHHSEVDMFLVSERICPIDQLPKVTGLEVDSFKGGVS